MLMLIKPIIAVICDTPFHIAYIYTPFLVLAVVYNCFVTFMGSIYVVSKQSKRSMVTTAAGAAANIGLNALLIPLIGIHGAAIATCVSYMAVFFIRVVDTKKFVFMNAHIHKLMTNTICLLGMGFVILFCKNMILFYLILILIFLFVVFVNYRACIKLVKLVLGKRKQ